MRRLKAEDLIAYARRDWGALSRLKAEHWAAAKERHGPQEGIRIADELRRQARLSHPDWPSREDRLADLEAHLRLSRELGSVAFARRR